MSPLFHQGRKLALTADQTIFDYADALKVRVPTSCGRTGECHECIVEVRQGVNALNEPTKAESFLRENYRLACQARVADPGALIEFQVLRRQPRILTDSIRRQVSLDPMVTKVGQNVTLNGERIDSYSGNIYGLAVDVGTTTVVMNLVDLESGEVIHTASFENPQRFGGSDIMHRISYDGGPYHGELRQVMLSSLNFEIGEMARQLKFHRRDVYAVVLVGNSTMRDILFGLDVQVIGEKPYMSWTELEMRKGGRETTAISTKARDIGLRVFPDAHIYGAPLVGCHVGSDIAADLLAIGIDEQDSVVMLVDIGTNSEVIIGNRHRLMAASCPAGPAFEGGQVTYGMPGYDGAVESVHIEGEETAIKTIGDMTPEGICGSGLVDLLAELRREGLMTELGVFNDGSTEYIFAPNQKMSLSRADISALAQAKSANYAGQYIILRKYGLPVEDISKLYLAGGFANYINVDNALNIGFIANVPPARIVKVGNAALEGATIMLISNELRRKMETLVLEIEHVELETTPDFFEVFVDGCLFNPMNFSISVE